jgi:aryl-alcohol dehydrogenase-like predicted oxidoreductase
MIRVRRGLVGGARGDGPTGWHRGGVPLDRLALTSRERRIGVGLAAVGRPGYINLGHDRDLPADRSVAALRSRSHELLDEAYSRGVRYIDVARSYGRAEEFVADWLRARATVDDVVIGSKWGYTYTAGWRIHADVHETKDHSVATFRRQLAETRALLGSRLDLYQVHSVTPESTALTDTALHRELVRLAEEGVTVGLSVSGPRQADAIRAALAEAHARGCTVIVKEALANGRLASHDPGGAVGAALLRVGAQVGARPDAVALAAALLQPWATIVLSGASTTGQLASNLAAVAVRLDPAQLTQLGGLAETAEEYWRRRAGLAWR